MTKVAFLKGLKVEKRTILRGWAGTIVRKKIARGKRNYTSLDFGEYKSSKSRI